MVVVKRSFQSLAYKMISFTCVLSFEPVLSRPGKEKTRVGTKFVLSFTSISVT